MGKKAYLLLGLLLILLAAAGGVSGPGLHPGRVRGPPPGPRACTGSRWPRAGERSTTGTGSPWWGTTRELLGAVAPTLESIGALETSTHGGVPLPAGPGPGGRQALCPHPAHLGGAPLRGPVRRAQALRGGPAGAPPHRVPGQPGPGGRRGGAGHGRPAPGPGGRDRRHLPGGRPGAGHRRGESGWWRTRWGRARPGWSSPWTGSCSAWPRRPPPIWDRGAVVITQVPDCEILALASVPDFHPDRGGGRRWTGRTAPLVNRAFSAYAPGSVFKLVVAAALLEQGRPVESFPLHGLGERQRPDLLLRRGPGPRGGGSGTGPGPVLQRVLYQRRPVLGGAGHPHHGLQPGAGGGGGVRPGAEVRGRGGCRSFPAWKTPGPWGTSPSARGSSPPRPCSCAPWSTPWPRKACTPPPSSCWGRWRPTAGPGSCPLSRTGRCRP